MIARVFSGAIVGLKCVLVEVEVNIVKKGLPAFHIVGLPDKAIGEAKERVRSAILNMKIKFPHYRITVNLAPADLPKEGPAYDLPIALGILIASKQLSANLSESLFFGELSLDGKLRHTAGVLPLALLAKEQGFKKLFLPKVNSREAAVVAGIKIYPLKSLLEIFEYLRGLGKIKRQPHLPFSKFQENLESEFNTADVKGQEHAKRGLEIAAAGGHNVLLYGVPGSGKTMLARAFPSILPFLTESEALEITKIYSITGNLPSGESIIKSRPFRSPHHTTSRVGLIGGGQNPLPGEISLAHRGVLFLDEFPEFPRHVLEALRQPLEDGYVSIARASGQVTYPAKFILLAAANPCPCGNLGSHHQECKCLPGQIIRYRRRVSGALLDRIDLHLACPLVPAEKLSQIKPGETSEQIRTRVQAAREIQLKRFKNTPLKSNGEMGSREIRQFCPLSSRCLSLLRQAVSTFNLSARGYHKIIKISQTIADLAGEEEIASQHLAEALQYRRKEEE